MDSYPSQMYLCESKCNKLGYNSNSVRRPILRHSHINLEVKFPSKHVFFHSGEFEINPDMDNVERYIVILKCNRQISIIIFFRFDVPLNKET